MKLGFSSRSDAVREVLHRFVAQNKWIERRNEDTPLIATIVYDVRKEDSVHNVLYGFKHVVSTAVHTHYGDKCVEWILLQGKDEDVRQFIKRLSGIKGINFCRCSV